MLRTDRYGGVHLITITTRSYSLIMNGTGRPTLHAVDGDAITVNNFRSGYDESDDFKVRMKRDDRCGK
jgi:hypothetical protein